MNWSGKFLGPVNKAQRAGLLAATCALLVSGGVYAMGDRQTQRMISVNCPQDVPAPQMLCDALIDAISEGSPSAAVKTGPTGSDITPKPNDLVVTLHLTHLTEAGIGGRLEWRTSESAEPTVGPTVDFDVMDTTMSEKFYPKYVQGLLKSTPELFAR